MRLQELGVESKIVDDRGPWSRGGRVGPEVWTEERRVVESHEPGLSPGNVNDKEDGPCDKGRRCTD